jgi:hypothetical protein
MKIGADHVSLQRSFYGVPSKIPNPSNHITERNCITEQDRARSMILVP